MSVHKFPRKKIFYVIMYKKDNKNVEWIVILNHRNLTFSHETQNCSFSEKLCANIECLDAYMNMFSNFFDILKYVFKQRVYIRPWDNMDFHIITSLFAASTFQWLFFYTQCSWISWPRLRWWHGDQPWARWVKIYLFGFLLTRYMIVEISRMCLKRSLSF
jgi:hypothetical protein